MDLETMLRWCRQHDWGTNARISGNFIRMTFERHTDNAGASVEHERVWEASDWTALRAWAGY